MDNAIDIEGIMEHLPHRIPFLMIDRVLEMDKEEGFVVAIKNVTINEWFFQGHFPISKVMPGVLILEGMAQTGGVLLMSQLGEEASEKLLYFMTIEKAKFRRPVVPGDRIRYEVHQTGRRKGYSRMHGRALVEGQVVAELEMTSAIVDKPR